MAQATRRRTEQQRRRIAAALLRIDQGGYGECVICGQAFAGRRLHAEPAVSMCLSCAESREA